LYDILHLIRRPFVSGPLLSYSIPGNFMSNKIHILTVLLAITFLGACGGGGGGDGGNGGSEYSISSDRKTVSFNTAYDVQEDDLSQTLTITYDGDGVLVGYPPDVDEPFWLNVNTLSTSDGTAVFELLINGFSTNAPLTFSTTLRFVTGKADGSSTAHTDVKVSYVRSDPLRFGEEDPVRPLTGKPGNAGGSQSLIVQTHSRNWEVTSNVNWLDFSVTSGSGTGTILVSPNSLADSLPAGEHTATVSLSDATSGNEQDTTQVVLYLDPHRIWFESAALPVTHFSGETTSTATMRILSTDANLTTAALTVQTDVDWLDTAIADDNHISVTVNSSELDAGSHYGKVQISANNYTSTQQLVVNLVKSNAAVSDIVTTDTPGGSSNPAVSPDGLRRAWFLNNELMVTNVATGTAQSFAKPFDTALEYYFSTSGDRLYAFVDSGEDITRYSFDLAQQAWVDEKSIFSFPYKPYFFEGLELQLSQQSLPNNNLEFYTLRTDLLSGNDYTLVRPDCTGNELACPSVTQGSAVHGKYAVQPGGLGNGSDAVYEVESNQQGRLITQREVFRRDRDCANSLNGNYQFRSSILSCGELFSVNTDGSLGNVTPLLIPPDDQPFSTASLMHAIQLADGTIHVLWEKLGNDDHFAVYEYDATGEFTAGTDVELPLSWPHRTYTISLTHDGRDIVLYNYFSGDLMMFPVSGS
jgi:hypothetical protein